MREITRDPKTPPSVEVRPSAREPLSDPCAGVPLVRRPGQPDTAEPLAAAPPKHRLATIGDSLTQGFQSGAVHRTALAYPCLIARELGADFRFASFPGAGGLPFDIEYVVRRLEAAVGPRLDWWELPEAALVLRSVMDEVEDYWERGPGADLPPPSGINENLAIYGWDLRDVLSRTPGLCARSIDQPKDQLVIQGVDDANARVALRVLPRTAPGEEGLGVLDAAEALGEDGGIETLIVLLGANNALRTIVELNVVWSADGYDDLERKSAFTVWRPEHFRAELGRVAERVRRIRARHVIWGTVPHVTIAPLARGVGSKIAADSRYFPYYTRPWIRDRDFDPNDDPCLSAAEVRAVDAAIDHYNEDIAEVVRSARSDPLDPRDWYVLDVAGLLDRLAHRRYVESPAARPAWWTPYELPPALAELTPPLNTHFFTAGAGGRTDGGLFSLDGVHPTTVCYGLLAQEFIRIMERAGVTFYERDGQTPRRQPVELDFRALLAEDSLLSNPPAAFSRDLRVVGWLDQRLDLVCRMLRVLD